MTKVATYIGEVQNVEGATVSAILSMDCASGLTYVNGEVYKIGQVGSFVRIPIGYNDLFGIVSKVGANAAPDNQIESQPHGNRWMTIQLIGESYHKTGFDRGISQYPTIGDEVHLVSEKDLKCIYGRLEKPHFVKVGHIAGAESIPALLDINKLIIRHSAVVGTTGAGKSTTVAGLLNALSNDIRYPSARIIVLDIHGEYANALGDRANIFKINANCRKTNEKELNLPFWALNADELIEICFGVVDEKSKTLILESILREKKNVFKLYRKSVISEELINADTPIPFSIKKIWYNLYQETLGTYYSRNQGAPIDNLAYELDDNGKEMKGDPQIGIPPTFKRIKNNANDPEKIYYMPNGANLSSQLISLGAKFRIPQYNFLFSPGDWEPSLDGNTKLDLDELFKGWIGNERPVTIFDLSGIPTTILNTIIGVLLRILYDALFWTRDLSQGGRHRPLLIIMEEAHNYLSSNTKNSASHIVQRIVKEGRKYGIGVMIVSQRPSEISETVLSQCGTFISLRLSNRADRGHICSAVSDNLESLTSMLPILKTGEAIILGESVKLPMRVFIEPPPRNHWPDSQDPVIYDEVESADGLSKPQGWGASKEQASDFKDFLAVWRSQNPHLRTQHDNKNG